MLVKANESAIVYESILLHDGTRDHLCSGSVVLHSRMMEDCFLLESGNWNSINFYKPNNCKRPIAEIALGEAKPRLLAGLHAIQPQKYSLPSITNCRHGKQKHAQQCETTLG